MNIYEVKWGDFGRKIVAVAIARNSVEAAWLAAEDVEADTITMIGIAKDDAEPRLVCLQMS